MGDDVELCLEVQVDPESKRILSNPERCRSALLDVTVVKPKELEAFGTQRTNTLRADEVRRLISSMERQRRKKQRVLDKLKDDDTIIKIRKHDDFGESYHRPRKPYSKMRERIPPKSPIDDLERKDFIGIAESVEPLFCEIRRSLKNVETRINNMQDINLEISETTIDEDVNNDVYSRRRRSRFTTDSIRNPSVYRVETSPRDLKSVLLCKNRHRYVDRGDKVEGKCLCENCGTIGMLMEFQKHPLLAELSESPPPSFHQQIMGNNKKTRFNFGNFENSNSKSRSDSTYIDNLINRVKLLEERLAAQEEKVVPKDYFKKVITKVMKAKRVKSKSDTSVNISSTKKTTPEKSPKHTPHAENVHVCNYCTADTQRSEKPPRTSKNDKAIGTDDEGLNSGYVWKWGEEILKPGIDIKNRIMALLSDMLGKMSTAEKTAPQSPVSPKEPIKLENCSSEFFRKFVKHMNSKLFNAQPKLFPENVCNFEKNQDGLRRESQKFNKKVDVSYVNPKLLCPKESPKVRIEKRPSSSGKQEFLKIVAKAKQHQKDVLWRNIWNQAVANGQSKSDKITIKIPCQSEDGREGRKLFETEITIGEVEEILKGF